MRIIETHLAFRDKPARRSRTDYIVLHHAAASRCTVYDVHQWHLDRVEPDGTRWTGSGTILPRQAIDLAYSHASG